MEATVRYSPAALTALEELRRALPPTVGVPEACNMLGISRAHGYALAARGEFPVRTLKVGGRYRVITASLIRVLEGDAA